MAHNGDAFDMKKLKGRILYHRLSPLTNISTIDTLKLSRANFNHNSHKLDYLTKYLGFKGKIETGGLKLWLDIEKGSKQALRKMIRYCKNDVTELEAFFLEILPHCERLPVNLSLIINNDKDGCPNCGNKSIQKWGYKYTPAGRYQRYKCNHCGHVYKDSRAS